MEVDVPKLTVKALRAELKARGLQSSGIHKGYMPNDGVALLLQWKELSCFPQPRSRSAGLKAELVQRLSDARLSEAAAESSLVAGGGTTDDAAKASEADLAPTAEEIEVNTCQVQMPPPTPPPAATSHPSEEKLTGGSPSSGLQPHRPSLPATSLVPDYHEDAKECQKMGAHEDAEECQTTGGAMPHFLQSTPAETPVDLAMKDIVFGRESPHGRPQERSLQCVIGAQRTLLTVVVSCACDFSRWRGNALMKPSSSMSRNSSSS